MEQISISGTSTCKQYELKVEGIIGMFNVETVMESIRREIQEHDILVSKQYFTTPYYRRRISECREKDDIIIFGSGNNGKLLYMILQKERINTVKGFCDNAKEKQGTFIKEMPVYSVEDAFKRYPNAYFISTVSGYENEIIRQLIKLGVPVDNIAVFIRTLSGLEN